MTRFSMTRFSMTRFSMTRFTIATAASLYVLEVSKGV